jgi:TonB family protein
VVELNRLFGDITLKGRLVIFLPAMKSRRNSGTRREPGAAVWTASMALFVTMAVLVSGCSTNQDIIPPSRVDSPILDYPPEAILKRESGELEVLLHLQEDGSVDELKIKRSTGIPILDESGMAFVNSLEFQPLVAHGRKQPCWVGQKVIFSLEKPSLDPFEWRRVTGKLIEDLETANASEQAGIHQRLYSQCADYMSSVIVHQDLTMNRIAFELVVPPLRGKWAHYENTFPMSFLMYADFVARIKAAPYHERALVQLRRSLEVDIHLIEESLRAGENPGLLHFREKLLAYLAELK